MPKSLTQINKWEVEKQKRWTLKKCGSHYAYEKIGAVGTKVVLWKVGGGHQKVVWQNQWNQQCSAPKWNQKSQKVTVDKACRGRETRKWHFSQSHWLTNQNQWTHSKKRWLRKRNSVNIKTPKIVPFFRNTTHQKPHKDRNWDLWEF
jgi:hypothetical protein